MDASLSVMPRGSNAVIFELSCGFAAIFDAIGFSVVLETEGDAGWDVVEVGLAFGPCVALPFIGFVAGFPAVVGLPVALGACACGAATAGFP
jgi:hypothetical protein